MPSYSLTFDNCDDEPLHLIGEIQDFGTLIVVDTVSRTIDFAAQNVSKYLTWKADDLVGKAASDVLPEDLLERLESPAPSPAQQETPIGGLDGLVRPEFENRLTCQHYARGDRAFVEFVESSEPMVSMQLDGQSGSSLIESLSSPKTVTEMLKLATQMVSVVSGYMRVMAYKFHDDNHGEVVAEVTTHEEKFLGLHYPASDIPEPARQQYQQNSLRIISDVWHDPVPLVKVEGRNIEPLDLSGSVLRGVSPFHIQYLKNMGVGASASVSIVVDGRLWGLIACHHDQRKWLSLPQQRILKFIGEVVGFVISRIQKSELLETFRQTFELIDNLERETVNSEYSVADIVLGRFEELSQLLDVDGIGLRIGGDFFAQGAVDQPAIGSRTNIGSDEHVWACSNLRENHPELVTDSSETYGLIFLALNADHSDYLVFSRREYIHSVSWGGAPGKKSVAGTRSAADSLMPRTSFESWTVSVAGQSKPFSPSTLEASRLLQKEFSAIYNQGKAKAAREAQAKAEWQQIMLLNRLMDATRLNSLSEVATIIAHELNQPLSAIVSYIAAFTERMKKAEYSLPDGMAALVHDASAEAVRAGNLMRRLRRLIERGEHDPTSFDLNVVVRDAVNSAISPMAAERVDVVFDLDTALTTATADQMQIEQVIFNLVRNAVEAMEGQAQQKLTVRTRILDEAVEISIADNGPGIRDDMVEDIFTPLSSGKATGMGIGLSLCRSIMRAHGGSIRAIPSNAGAEFVVLLPHLERS